MPPNRAQRRKLKRSTRKALRDPKFRTAVQVAARQATPQVGGLYLPAPGAPKTTFVLPPGFILPSSVQHKTEKR